MLEGNAQVRLSAEMHVQLTWVHLSMMLADASSCNPANEFNTGLAPSACRLGQSARVDARYQITRLRISVRCTVLQVQSLHPSQRRWSRTCKALSGVNTKLTNPFTSRLTKP